MTRTCVYVIAVILLFPFFATAQDAFDQAPELEAPPEPFLEHPPPEHHPGPPFDEGGERFGPGGPRGGDMGRPHHPHLERWMEQMREHHPEEFERLNTLHEENPEAFRRNLQKRLRREKWKAAMQGRRGRKGDLMTPEIERLEKESREMGRTYRKAATDEEKEAIKADLRVKLNELFDLRQAERQKRITQVEKRVAELKNSIEKREAHRDDIINHRLLDITEGQSVAW